MIPKAKNPQEILSETQIKMDEPISKDNSQETLNKNQKKAYDMPGEEDTITQNPVEYQSEVEDLTDEEPVGESSKPEYEIEADNNEQTDDLENLFTVVYPHDWQNAYAEYLNDIDFNRINLHNIYIKDIKSDDIPEIIIIYTRYKLIVRYCHLLMEILKL